MSQQRLSKVEPGKSVDRMRHGAPIAGKSSFLLHSLRNPAGHRAGHQTNLNQATLNFQQRLSRTLHAEWVETGLNVLLVIDLVLVIVAMNLEIAYLESKITDFEHACTQQQCPSSHSAFHHFGSHGLETAVHCVVYVSIGCLVCFLLHNILLMVAAPTEFFCHPWHILDLCVVLVSLVFELIDKEGVSVGILVLVRCWHFVRVGHGVHELDESGEHTHEYEEQKEKATLGNSASIAPCPLEENPSIDSHDNAHHS